MSPAPWDFEPGTFSFIMGMMVKGWCVFLGVLLLLGCSSKLKQAVVDSDVPAMRLGPPPSELLDDLNLEGLRESLQDHINYFRSFPERQASVLKFGTKEVPVVQYVHSLEELLKQIPPVAENSARFKLYVLNNFHFYEVAGDGRPGEAFMTSYFNPVFRASRRPSSEFSRPIYSLPPDMVIVKIDRFMERFPHWSLWGSSEQKSAGTILRGRVVAGDIPPQILPYYDRQELDSLGILRGQGLELAYADPLEIFIMQIQGSGTLQFSSGERMRVGYLAQNGHPYVAIGKFLQDKIPSEKMSLASIEAELRKMPSEQMQQILNKNPSYVFFQKLNSEPLTSIGTIVRAGRTIATDRRYFPKGTLAFMQFNKPIFANKNDSEPTRWEKASRFVMDQDTGGAIRGTGRLDLYWGEGSEARQAAGVMKQWGKLWYLVPKDIN